MRLGVLIYLLRLGQSIVWRVEMMSEQFGYRHTFEQSIYMFMYGYSLMFPAEPWTREVTGELRRDGVICGERGIHLKPTSD